MLLWIIGVFAVSLFLILLSFIEDKLLSSYYRRNNKEKNQKASESLKRFLNKFELTEVEVIYTDNGHSDFYNSKQEKIVLHNDRKAQGSLIDHYVSIHEAYHSLQKKEGHRPSQWRYKWGERYKLKHAVAFVILFVYTAILNVFDESLLWNVLIAAYFVCIYLINNIPAILSEVNASIRAYKYLSKEFPLDKSERRMLKFRIFISIRDYIILSPYSIFI